MTFVSLSDDVIAIILRSLHPVTHVIVDRVSHRFSKLVRKVLYGSCPMALQFPQRCFSQTLSGWHRTTVDNTIPSNARMMAIFPDPRCPDLEFFELGNLRFIVSDNIVMLNDRWEPIRTLPIDKNWRLLNNTFDPGPDFCFAGSDFVVLVRSPELHIRYISPFPNANHVLSYDNGKIVYCSAAELGLYIVRGQQYELAWSQPCSDPSSSTITITSGRVLQYNSGAYSLYDAEDGRLLWKQNLIHPTGSTLAMLDYEGRIIAYEGWQRMSCYDPNTGQCVVRQSPTFELKKDRRYEWAGRPIVLGANMIVSRLYTFGRGSHLQLLLIDLLVGEQMIVDTEPGDAIGELFVVYRKGPLQPARMASVSVKWDDDSTKLPGSSYSKAKPLCRA